MTHGPLPGETNFVAYSFDARNRLTGVGGVTYQYDAENNRIAKTTAAGVTSYIFDPHGDALPRVLVRERPDESLTYYVYGIGLLYEVDETDNATYYHFDQSGSTVALTNDAGVVTDRVEYTPYGTISHRTGATDTPFLYAGQFGIQQDPNGLLHMRARFYSPELKRFINADPAGFDGGMNWYAYANNSPLMYVDPDGEVAFLALGLAMLAGGTSNVIIGAALSAITGEDYSWGNAGRDFAIGAAFGSLGGAGIALQKSQRLSRAAAPLFRKIHRIPRLAPAKNNMLTRTRRLFLEDTRTFTARSRFNSSCIGRKLNSIGDFQLHHVSIQQSGIRRASRIYPAGSQAASGLQRVGDAGVNLLPVPKSLNQFLNGRPLATSAFGGAVFGGGLPGSARTGWATGEAIK
ncbi:MAG: RHS repeat-associated core domain-containing protein [Verrucomicrobia bacterium]|nr:RHS repeat-associated core domain-containing protein [Verrucomicrobiota bacterium]